MECVLGQWAVRNAVERKEERLLPGVRGQNHTTVLHMLLHESALRHWYRRDGNPHGAAWPCMLAVLCRESVILQSNIVALDIYSILAYDLL
jgi:hypothetical protein